MLMSFASLPTALLTLNEPSFPSSLGPELVMGGAIASLFRRFRSRALADLDFGGGSKGGWYLNSQDK
jgi:hypothetical protein